MKDPVAGSMHGAGYGASRSPSGPIAVVLGASGYMGSNLTPALAAEGWQVRAVARNAAVLAGADVVYYLVHMMWSGDFVPVERRAAENARKACEAAGARRSRTKAMTPAGVAFKAAHGEPSC